MDELQFEASLGFLAMEVKVQMQTSGRFPYSGTPPFLSGGNE